MSPTVTDLDHLPPEGRFTLRAVAGGLSYDEVADVLRIDGPTVRKHLRSVVRHLGGDPPSAAAGDDRLREALGPALAAAATGPGRRPALRCPAPAIADALARGALDGPLVLAQAEHAADCASCMARVVDVRRGRIAPVPAAAAPAPRRLLRPDAPLALGLLLGIAAALAYLFLR